MSEKKHLALPALLRELAECLKAASGDESTQGSEAETVASRMQSLLLALVDNCTKSQRPRERELVSVMKLINLAMQRLPAAFIDDSCRPVTTMLVSIFPLFSDVSLRAMHKILLQTICALLSLAAHHCRSAYKAILQDVLDLSQDLHVALRTLSSPAALPPEWAISIAAFHSSLLFQAQMSKNLATAGTSGQIQEVVISLTSLEQCQVCVAQTLQVVTHCMSTTPFTVKDLLQPSFGAELMEISAHGGFTVQAAGLGTLAELMKVCRLTMTEMQAISITLCQNLGLHMSHSVEQAPMHQLWQTNICTCCRILCSEVPGPNLAGLFNQLFRTAVHAPIQPEFQQMLFELVLQRCDCFNVEVQAWIDILKSCQQPVLDGRALECIAKCLRRQIKPDHLDCLNRLITDKNKMQEVIDVGDQETSQQAKRQKIGRGEGAVIDLASSPQQVIELGTQSHCQPLTGRRTISRPHSAISQLPCDLAVLIDRGSNAAFSIHDRLANLNNVLKKTCFHIPGLLPRVAPILGEWISWSLSPTGPQASRLQDISQILDCANSFLSAVLRQEVSALGKFGPQLKSDLERGQVMQLLAVTKEQMKSFTLIPFMPGLGVDSSMSVMPSQLSPTHDSASLGKAQVSALRVYAAASFFGVVDNHSCFAKGNIGFKAEKCKDDNVLATYAILLPVIIQNSPRPSRLVQSAINSYVRLADLKTHQVSQAVVQGFESLLRTPVTRDGKVQATVKSLLDSWNLSEHKDNMSATQIAELKCNCGSHQKGTANASVAAVDLQRLLDSILWTPTTDESVQAKMLEAAASWFSLASGEELQKSGDILKKCLQLASNPSAPIRHALLKAASALTRPEIVQSIFVEDTTSTGQPQTLRAEAQLLQAFRELSLKQQPEAVLLTILQTIAAYGAHLKGEKAELLVLCVLLGRIDDSDLSVRSVAAQLLLEFARKRGSDLGALLLGAPKVLQFLGHNVAARPHLLDEVADLVGLEAKEVAQKVLIASIPFLAETKDEEALKALSGPIGTDTRALVHDYGHYAVAQFMFNGKKDLAMLLEFMEQLLGQNFITYLTEIMPHVILEMFRIAGSSETWGQDVEAPTQVLARLGHLLQELSRIQRGPSDAASFLADTDNATRLLKACGDALERYARQDAEGARRNSYRPQQEVVRGVVLLIHLITPHAARFMPQIMVLLSTSMGRSKPVEVKLQALEGYRILVKSLANSDSATLSSIINQVVVTLLDSLQEGGPLTPPATQVLEDIVINHRSCLTAEIKALPLLPASLSKVNDVITQERGKLTSSEQIQLLLASLGDNSLSVRTTALQELRDYLNQHRQFLANLLAGSTNAATQNSHAQQSLLLSKLVEALLRCCDAEIHSPLALKAHLLCAECLGLVGAVDPARLEYEPKSTDILLTTAGDLIIELISKHLVRLLRVADSLMTLEAAVYALQELLRKYGAEPTDLEKEGEDARVQENSVFLQLPEDVQTLVKPYLDSRYVLAVSKMMPPQVVFNANGSSFRRWLYSWLRTLIENFADGTLQSLFKSCTLVLRHDIQTCQFLMPYVIQNVIKSHSDEAFQLVKQEIETVLHEGHSSKEGELCVQAIFTLLDMLKGFVADLKDQAAREEASGSGRGSGRISSPAEAEEQTRHITDLINSIPLDLLAQAAFRCNAHARALQYYESYVRKTEDGAYNPAALKNATYTDEEVTFLQEIYGKLEEPDGLSGLMKLRSGGLSLQDQVLAAEKTGSWTEAAALYEQALKQDAKQDSGIGLSSAQYGHLQCLLQMGHLQTMLAQVDGWMKTADEVAAAQLAAVGTAGAWRLGRWDLLKQYLQDVTASADSLSADELWELRIGKLLLSVSNRERVATTNALQEARLAAMAPLIAASTESYTRAYPYLVKLHMLQELSDTAVLLQEASLAGPLERQRRLRWTERLKITQSSLPVQEPILALRRQLAVLSGSEKEAGLCWLQQAKICRATGHFEAAVAAGLEALAREVPGAVIENAKLLWDTDQPYRAIARLQQDQQTSIDTGRPRSTQTSPGQRAEMDHSKTQILLQLARWMADTGQGAASDITGLFKQAISLEAKSEKAYFYFAKFLDQLMEDAKKRQTAHVSSTSKHMDRMGGKSKIQVGEDRPFVEYIAEIIYNYGKAVQCGHRNIYQALPRMLTVWFDFGTHYLKLTKPSKQERQALSDIQHTMQRLAKELPLYLWLVALPQLTSRICHPHQPTQDMTQHIMTRLTAAYPQQALWALVLVTKSKVSSRNQAANAILRIARKQQTTNEETKQLYQQFHAFCDQLIRLCHHNPGDRVRVMSARSDMSQLVRMMPLAVLIPTTGTLSLVLPPGGPVDKDHKPFTNAVTIQRLKDRIEVMTSLMKPKKVVFVGSDGKDYPFLLKPDDDLRKDTRLMETAGLLNRLFAREPLSRRRNLFIRRFAVTPLTESCGLIEWVNHTTGLRQCCHAVYRPAGLLHRTSNPTIKAMYDSYKGKRMADLFNKVLKMYPPLLHNFFLSTFTDPASWHNARLTFTQTSAVWCMVGHMLGLGDRHGENILMDTSTGACIHIDFACLFDKGLTLAKPEMVPFRLTQNIIDAFGVSGYEGVFRKVSEITLRVLRNHRDALANVLETFVHDPLVDWTGHGHACLEDGTENPQAKDAMATIQGRLTGTLLGVRSIPSLPLSVEGQVHRLIEEATDKENLGSMYIWWMAWF